MTTSTKSEIFKAAKAARKDRAANISQDYSFTCRKQRTKFKKNDLATVLLPLTLTKTKDDSPLPIIIPP